jgi:hypothetical protein
MKKDVGILLKEKSEMKKTLTSEEAYDAMYDFLEKFYDRTKSEDVGLLLSDLSLLRSDEKSLDPATIIDWQESVAKVLSQNPRQRPYLTFVNQEEVKK